MINDDNGYMDLYYNNNLSIKWCSVFASWPGTP